MIENIMISAKEYEIKCKKCRHNFNHISYWCGYGYRGLDCERCNEAYFVDCDADPVFKITDDLSKIQFPGHKVKAPFGQDPEIQWFEREFEKTCDSCQCGGKLKFAQAPKQLTCPMCGSSDLTHRTKKTIAPPELKIYWVTHKNWEEKNKGKLNAKPE